MSTNREIRFEDVSVRFQGAPNDGWVIDKTSLSFGNGEFVSIIGPSGCGKTTLLKLAAGMILPTNGKVMLDGREITGPGPERGVVFQEYGVFPWLTVKENIAFGLRLKENRKSEPEIQIACDKYLDLMGLAEFQNSLPNTLSGGMRQRVALARTYAVNPDFLLMDEPFGALDAQTRLAMQDLLLELQQREVKSVFLITHSVEEAIYLSSKIVLVSARPARITEVIDVPFGYPRDESLLRRPEFTELQALLRVKVMNEYQNQLQKDRNPIPIN